MTTKNIKIVIDKPGSVKKLFSLAKHLVPESGIAYNMKQIEACKTEF